MPRKVVRQEVAEKRALVCLPVTPISWKWLPVMLVSRGYLSED